MTNDEKRASSSGTRAAQARDEPLLGLTRLAQLSHLLGLASLLALCLFSGACSSDPSAWHPRGSASIASWREQEESGTKLCVFTLRIRNAGVSTIGTSTVSVRVATDKCSYFATILDSKLILPGGEIYADAEIAYDSAEEETQPPGPSIIDEFYY
ncbi:MAG TPA: hypothetical protein VIO60_11755 [Rectinemataceae bacterium]